MIHANINIFCKSFILQHFKFLRDSSDRRMSASPCTWQTEFCTTLLFFEQPIFLELVLKRAPGNAQLFRCQTAVPSMFV
jgi:hypothetical protein